MTAGASEVMSVDELLNMDDMEFQLHDHDNSPEEWLCYLDSNGY